MSVSASQLRKLRHALGLEWGKEVCRNGYTTREDCPEYADCAELERLGFMKRHVRQDGWSTFEVTEAGKAIAMEVKP